MRDLNYYLKLEYPFNIEPISKEDGSGYLISFPDLKGCISDGDTIEKAIRNGEDAKRVWIEASFENNLEIPEPRSTDSYSGQFKLRIPKILHKELSDLAKIEGTSMNQYCLYLLSKSVGYKQNKEL